MNPYDLYERNLTRNPNLRIFDSEASYDEQPTTLPSIKKPVKSYDQQKGEQDLENFNNFKKAAKHTANQLKKMHRMIEQLPEMYK